MVPLLPPLLPLQLLPHLVSPARSPRRRSRSSGSEEGSARRGSAQSRGGPTDTMSEEAGWRWDAGSLNAVLSRWGQGLVGWLCSRAEFAALTTCMPLPASVAFPHALPAVPAVRLK